MLFVSICVQIIIALFSNTEMLVYLAVGLYSDYNENLAKLRVKSSMVIHQVEWDV